MKSMNLPCTTACPLADLKALRDASAVLEKVPSPMRKFGTLYKKRNQYHFGDTKNMI